MGRGPLIERGRRERKGEKKEVTVDKKGKKGSQRDG